MSNLWNFAVNVFANATRHSFKLMYEIGISHLNKLSAQNTIPEIQVMYGYILPLWNLYRDNYNQWKSLQNTSQGSTQAFTDKMDELKSVKIADWDVRIQVHYPKTTPQYKALLPHNRTPFNSKSYEQRISALSALILAIDTDVNLQVIKTEMIAFRDEAVVLRTTQMEDQQHLSNISDELEQDRLTLSTGIYKNLGGLMSYYYANPVMIENYFDLSLIRKTGTTHPKITKTLAVNSTFNWQVAFSAGTVIRVKNLSQVLLHFGRAASATEPITSGASLPPGIEGDFNVDALGNGDFLNFTNMDPINKLKFSAEVL